MKKVKLTESRWMRMFKPLDEIQSVYSDRSASGKRNVLRLVEFHSVAEIVKYFKDEFEIEFLARDGWTDISRLNIWSLVDVSYDESPSGVEILSGVSKEAHYYYVTKIPYKRGYSYEVRISEPGLPDRTVR